MLANVATRLPGVKMGDAQFLAQVFVAHGHNPIGTQAMARGDAHDPWWVPVPFDGAPEPDLRVARDRGPGVQGDPHRVSGRGRRSEPLPGSGGGAADWQKGQKGQQEEGGPNVRGQRVKDLPAKTTNPSRSCFNPSMN